MYFDIYNYHIHCREFAPVHYTPVSRFIFSSHILPLLNPFPLFIYKHFLFIFSFYSLFFPSPFFLPHLSPSHVTCVTFLLISTSIMIIALAQHLKMVVLEWWYLPGIPRSRTPRHRIENSSPALAI